MAKKIGWAVVGVILALAVSVFAADVGYLGNLPRDLATIMRGILSPRQISTLMDFRRDHGKDFHLEGKTTPDLFKTWKELNLSEEQQERLLQVAGDLADKAHPYLMSAIETGVELKAKGFRG